MPRRVPLPLMRTNGADSADAVAGPSPADADERSGLSGRRGGSLSRISGRGWRAAPGEGRGFDPHALGAGRPFPQNPRPGSGRRSPPVGAALAATRPLRGTCSDTGCNCGPSPPAPLPLMRARGADSADAAAGPSPADADERSGLCGRRGGSLSQAPAAACRRLRFPPAFSRRDFPGTAPPHRRCGCGASVASCARSPCRSASRPVAGRTP